MGGRKSTGWKSGIRNGLAVDNTPIFSTPKVLGNLLQQLEVQVTGAGGELAEGSHSIADIRTAGDISKKEFSKKSSVGKTVGVRELGVFRSTFIRTNVLIDTGDSV